MFEDVSISVPNLVGLSWREAKVESEERGLGLAVAEGSDPQRSAVGRPLGVVADQAPLAGTGTDVDAGTIVYVWMSSGRGDAGVREPRRPIPEPGALTTEADETAH